MKISMLIFEIPLNGRNNNNNKFSFPYLKSVLPLSEVFFTVAIKIKMS